MVQRYTDKELKEKLSALAVICDKREQRGEHISRYLDDKKIKHIDRSLEVGDYSAQIGDITFEYDIAIERKGGLDELAGNLTADRNRFEREFLRAKANGTKVYLLIENASWEDIFLHNYRSKLSEKSLYGSLLSWQTRFNVTIVFCKHESAPKLIHGILHYAVKEIITGKTLR